MPDAYRLLTVSTPLDGDEPAFILTAVRGREELSRPFSFQLELVAETSTAIAPADLVGKPVAWTVSYPNEVTRQFHGVVKSLVAGEFIGRSRRVYRVEVVPWLWLLTRTTNCQIFQTKTAPDIIDAVFKAFGFTSDHYRLNLNGTYPKREYCVQYRETAFDFVSRLMEEEGIFYYFEYAADKHTLVLADATSAYSDCDPHSAPEYRPELPDAAVVSVWQRQHEFRSGKYAHTDYNFETPSTNLLATSKTTVSLTDIAKYELFDYPGNHAATAVGSSRSTVRMQEAEVGYDTATGTSRCSSFMPGGKFTLDGHATDTIPFVLTAVEHEASEPLTAGARGGGGTYTNTFTAIPASVPFRPERRTQRPVVAGLQPALVVGPSGEEIYTDKYGRVKVHFPWDRVGVKDGTDSCWLRVSELWAGKNWGMIFTPRIGQEVLVEFLEGDPDRPIVTGRVYNAEQMPPYALPDNMTQCGLKTRSTKEGTTDHFNELRFEDKKDSEQVYFHAQKDFVRVVENNDSLTVGSSDSKTCPDGSQTISIYKDRTTTLQIGNETLTVSKGNRSVTVSEGNDSLTVTKGKRTVDVKADHTVTVQEGNRTVTVSKGNDSLTVSKGNLTVDVTKGDATIEAGNSITLKVGSNSIVIDTSSITLTFGGSSIKLDSSAIALSSTKVDVSGTTVSVAGDSEVKVSGAMADISGSGTCKISGGVVMIN